MYKIQPDTVARTIILFLSLINQFLIVLGKHPLPCSEDEIYALVSAATTVVATIWSWWKNNSFTQKALDADDFMKAVNIGDKEN